MGLTVESGKLERCSFQLQKWETLGEETIHDFGQENFEIPVVAQVREISRGQLDSQVWG